MTSATFPSSIKTFGSDAIDGEYILAGHINELRAEVTAIEQSLGANLANTLSAAAFPTKGAIVAGSAAATFSSLAVGQPNQLLRVDPSSSTGLAWVTPADAFAPRMASLASGASITPNITTTDQLNITTLAVDAVFAAPSGSAIDGQKLIIRVKDNGTTRALGWNSLYRAFGSALPTNTSAGKTVYVGFIFNAAETRWDCVAQAMEV
jgi:hypothetical protein